MKLVHPAETSKAAAFLAPILAWMKQPVQGKNISGLLVPVMIRSRSSGDKPAISRARRAAWVPRSEVATSFSTILRSRMPEREVIHSSEVSTIFSKSKLVRTLGGT